MEPFKNIYNKQFFDGFTKAMDLFGFDAVKNISIQDFQILTPKVKIGESSKFSSEVNRNSKTSVYFYSRKIIWKGCY
jgi:hypothetical protein